jgi:DNA modification methylase
MAKRFGPRAGPVELWLGDAAQTMRRLPAESVQAIVTSPPYWGLRDYGTARWEGGSSRCDHKHGGQVPHTKHPAAALVFRTGLRPGSENSVCPKCGGRRVDDQIGLEHTPELYVDALVRVFAEARRVLSKDGSLWLVLGDSFFGSWQNYGGGHRGAGKQRPIIKGSSAQNPVWEGTEGYRPAATLKHPMLKPKDLVGIPWRVAFALQADGWFLRSDIVWSKPNPMPESVKDRPTRAHEFMFLLAKSERYLYDAAAIAEPAASDTPARYERGRSGDHKYIDGGPGQQTIARSLEHMRSGSGNKRRIVACAGERGRLNTHLGSSVPWTNNGVRNKRSVWTVSKRGYKGAHFATFPPELIEPCILAGTRPGDSVLDPFSGAGTTGLVALQHGRRYIGIDINPEYHRLAMDRLQPLIERAG